PPVRLVDRPMMRFPEAVVTRPANVEAVTMAAGMFCNPIGCVGGGDTGTGVMRPVAVSRRCRPAVPRITTFPSFPTAIASGREPTLESVARWRGFRMIVLIVFEPTLGIYGGVRAGISAQ